MERDAVRLYEQGWSIRQVADRFSLSYGVMRRIWARARPCETEAAFAVTILPLPS